MEEREAIRLALVGGSTIDGWGNFFAEGRSDVTIERRFTVETKGRCQPRVLPVAP